METLEEAKQVLRDNWKDGVECPCCRQYVKLYVRPMHSTMALTLIRLYRLNQEKGAGYFHVKEIVQGISDTGTNDFSKLRYWNLIQEQPNDSDKRTSGFWGITGRGKLFVEGKLAVPARIKLFNKKCYGFEGDEITIEQVLGDKFNYQELMGSGAKGQWL